MSEPMLDRSPAANETAQSGMPFAPAFVLLASFAAVLIVIILGTAGAPTGRSAARINLPPMAARARDYVRYC